jgi:hypothetical protein
MEWLKKLPRKEGYYWVASLWDETVQDDLLEVENYKGQWMARTAGASNVLYIEEVQEEGFRFYGPIEKPEYDVWKVSE